ncbi:bifunctional metallophosphatase/5'-nucleotidase [Micromonospora viridifaciens]|uniref:bifunctional metallophosphatase/5'-nucleotidase n=1 Tax=Micromonospora viridifaciens TaxID=1881 RepID=UPI0018D56DCD|nr:bifunctional metallophosphatase/5'-nucleotidase [Micromonospora viridifaciens]
MAVTAAAALLAVGFPLQAAAQEGATAPDDATGRKGTVPVQLLNITDYHGALVATNSTLSDSAGNQYLVGGGAYVAAHLDRLAAGHKNSLRISNGDAISSAPAYDQWHRNEPSVEFLNHIGVDLNVIGNHEFDHSAEFLFNHLDKGKCMFGEEDVDSCFVDSQGERFRGSDFPYISANFVERDSGKPVAPPYVIKQVRDGTGASVRVAVIGVTFQRDGNLETQSYQPGLLGLDAVETTNKYADELDRRGVKAIVLSIHEGGSHSGAFDNCVNPRGDVFNMLGQISPKVDAIITGHTHSAFNCMLPDPDGNPRPIAQPSSHGKLINEMNLQIDRATGDVVRSATTSVNHPVTRDIEPDPVVSHMAEYWPARQAEMGAQPVTEVAGDFTRTLDATGQSTLGNAAADAMYEDSQLLAAAPADLAVVPVGVFSGSNPFVGDVLYAPGTNPADAPGTLLYEEWLQSFGYRNPVLTVTVTGEAIHNALEGQWRLNSAGAEQFRPLAVSGNTRYSFDQNAPIGDRVDPADVLINGEPLALDREYRLAGLTYNLWGRDGHTALADFTEGTRTSVDQDAFLTYLRRHALAEPPALDRISIKP